ncbi:hypothetical protein J2Z21_003703 [Streptomyces griseochromogenes]|uniref:Uncharacterized protein n=1 Tax=Streptomyces griseochromogenes TaxID=68214 RepID=A0A1B1AP08_9ACTN|nr:hypothetical protein [Streptomyces griseochromogenes]ANP48309.1 hypothetical protein AVL59_00830 [Streptomyces griseochromogenes]MBP2050753.1 hypothetical protein [Streptomyces griseochromogenes]
MAQAAPVTGGTTRGGRTPDVFSERTHAAAKVVVPVVLGLVYGYWAAANTRYGGPITGWNLLFGFVTAIVFAAVWMGLAALTPRLPRELHAALWASFTGIAVGFLYSLSGRGHSVLGSAGMGLAFAVVAFAVLFYRYYTHEDAEGHRIR